MSAAAGAPAVSIADARLVARLRVGEHSAFDELVAARRDAIWSVCVAMAPDRTQARRLFGDVVADLRRAVRGWDGGRPVPCQLAACVYRAVAASLELGPVDGILPEDTAPVHGAPTPERAAAVVRAQPAADRLVYLLDLFLHCPLTTLAAAVGEDEGALRAARARVCLALMGAP